MGISTRERYLGARTSSNLRLVEQRTGSADVLIAAGLVAANSERKSTALNVWGVMVSDQMNGARAMSDVMGHWIHGRSLAMREKKVVGRVVGSDVAMMVLKWYRHPACPDCNGHGHPLLPDSPVLDEARVCPVCHGSGQIDLAKLVQPEHAEHAQWLALKVNSMCSLVFTEMSRKLNQEMDFK